MGNKQNKAPLVKPRPCIKPPPTRHYLIGFQGFLICDESQRLSTGLDSFLKTGPIPVTTIKFKRVVWR